VNSYSPEDTFAGVPRMAERVDLILKELDRLLDELYQQVLTDFVNGIDSCWCMVGIRR